MLKSRALLGSAAMALALSASHTALGQATGSEEVVVTANKVGQKIQDVGMSIQAASGDRLTQLGITDTSQLTKIVPGFSFTPTSYGTPVYAIRGVGFLDTTLSAGPAVSVYQDEIPLPFSIISQGASLDVARVEVLKGPQGTLYGQNATGGAINYIAARPTDVFEAGFDVSYGSFNTVDAQGFVSGPVSDTLRMRLALRAIQGNAWQKSYTRSDRLGEQDFLNGRLLLDWDATQDLTFHLNLSAWRDKGESTAPQFYGSSALSLNAGLPAGFLTYPTAPDDAHYADWNPGLDYHKDNRFYSASLRADYDLGDDLVLSSLTAYQDFKRYHPIEGDGTIYYDYFSEQTGRIKTFYQELRLTGTFGVGGNWIIGGNYEKDDTTDLFLQDFRESSASNVFGIDMEATYPYSVQGIKTYGVFGNAEYPILPDLTVQAGIRYTKSERSFEGCGLDDGRGLQTDGWSAVAQAIQDYLQGLYAGSHPGYTPTGHDFIPSGGCGTLGPAPDYHPQVTFDELDEDNVSWRVGLNYKPDEDLLLYANVSKGFKAGSFPTLAPASYVQFKPATQESLLAYEIGFKSTLAGGDLQINGAAFYYDYTDKQILGSTPDPVFGPLGALINVPKSRVTGFELQVLWEPVDGLSINGNVSYQHSKITETNPAIINYKGELIDVTGDRFPYSPEWQAALDVQYEWQLTDAFQAFVGGNLNYQGDRDGGFGHPDILNMPSYTLLDLRLGVETAAWKVQLWGRNVTDEYYFNTAGHVNDAFVHSVGMPATYGVTVSYRFE